MRERPLNLVDHSQADVRVPNAKLFNGVHKRQHQPAHPLKIGAHSLVRQAIVEIHDAA